LRALPTAPRTYDDWKARPRGFCLVLDWVLPGGGELVLKAKYDALGQLAGVYQVLYPAIDSVLAVPASPT
jgi:hypothetical protein